jgi:hypothetical protein
MSRRGACCKRPCLIFGDEFDRSDNTNLGADWWEYGDWAISSHQLVSAGIGQAVARKPHPVSTPSGTASVLIMDFTDGLKYRVFVNSNYLGTVYDYAELEIIGTGLWLRCGVHPGSPCDELYLGTVSGVVGEGSGRLNVCHDRTGVYGSFEISAYVHCCPGPGTITNRYAGVAAMVAGTHLFDSFICSRSWRL